MKINKKVLALICVAIALILFVVFINSFANKKEEISYEYEKDATSLLPNIMTIDSTTHPLIYDFVNGSLGYHTKSDFLNHGSYFAILFEEEKLLETKTAYVSYYTYGEVINRPILGTVPVLLTLTNEQAQRIINNIDSSLFKYREGNWSLIVVSQYESSISLDGEELIEPINYCDAIGRWLNIDLTFSIQAEMGRMYGLIYDEGLGWPIDYLSKGSFPDILYADGYDIADPFWMLYNIDSYIDYCDINGDELRVYVSQLNSFRFNKNGLFIQVNEEQLKEMLELYGYSKK